MNINRNFMKIITIIFFNCCVVGFLQLEEYKTLQRKILVFPEQRAVLNQTARRSMLGR